MSPKSGISEHERTAIGVWGLFTGRNLGDELVVDVIIDAIESRTTGKTVVAISSAPSDAADRHGVAAYPLNPARARGDGTAGRTPGGAPATTLRAKARRVPGARRMWGAAKALVHVGREFPFSVRTYRRLRELDRVVVAGSGALLDRWNGPWGHPYATFRWALLARLARTEMLYPSVGAGPIDHPLSRLMFRKALKWASFVSVRDQHSANVLRTIGVVRELPVCPDMGWAFVLDQIATREPPSTTDPVVVGVNPMSHEDSRYLPRGDAARYETYLLKLAEFVASLLEQGERVLLFSSQSTADANVALDLKRILRPPLANHPSLESAIEKTANVDALLRAVSRCDYVVAGRFHSVLLPTALGIPTIGLAYDEKTCELLRDVGRPERCLDIDRFEVEDLHASFRRMRAQDGNDERRSLRAASLRLRASVEAQFNHLFGDDDREHG
jgi:polysaccharide pyruvyl transferase WcaK-like protein